MPRAEEQLGAASSLARACRRISGRVARREPRSSSGPRRRSRELAAQRHADEPPRRRRGRIHRLVGPPHAKADVGALARGSLLVLAARSLSWAPQRKPAAEGPDDLQLNAIHNIWYALLLGHPDPAISVDHQPRTRRPIGVDELNESGGQPRPRRQTQASIHGGVSGEADVLGHGLQRAVDLDGRLTPARGERRDNKQLGVQTAKGVHPLDIPPIRDHSNCPRYCSNQRFRLILRNSQAVGETSDAVILRLAVDEGPSLGENVSFKGVGCQLDFENEPMRKVLRNQGEVRPPCISVEQEGTPESYAPMLRVGALQGAYDGVLELGLADGIGVREVEGSIGMAFAHKKSFHP